jgi:hypothetical protein
MTAPNKITNAQRSVCCYAGGRKSNPHLSNYQLLSGERNSIEHLLLTSSAAILFDFSPGLDIINTSTAASPER